MVLVVSLLSLVLVGTANLVMGRRVDAAAQRAIAGEAALLSGTAGRTAPGRPPEEGDEEEYYTVELIALDPPGAESRDGAEATLGDLPAEALNARQRRILNALRSTELDEAPRRLEVDGSDVMVRSLDAEGRRYALFVDLKETDSIAASVNRTFAFVLVLLLPFTAWIGVRAGRRVEDAQGRLRAFFANASHDLKTPLQVVSGYAEAIEQGIAPATEAARIISAQSLKMTTMVEDLLLLSKVNARAYEWRFSEEPLGLVIGEAAVGAAPLAASAGVDLVVGGQRIDERCEEAEVQGILERSPEYRRILRADHDMLLRALSNIVSNATRYASSLVEISAEASGRLLLVHVDDDGPGIREEDLPHLFERHFTGWEGKSGIGLSFVKEVADAHGARLEAGNRPGGGARFTLALRARPQTPARGVLMRRGT